MDLPGESSSIKYLFTPVLSQMPLFLPWYPSNATEEQSWDGVRHLKKQELTDTMARNLDWLCLAYRKGGV